MRRWTRARLDLRCGLCHVLIPAGEPVQEVWLAELPLPKWRCPVCAGENVPADLPPLEPITKPIQPQPKSSPLVKLGELVKDWKQAQAGDE